MWLLGIGIVLLVLKWTEYGPVAKWSWWLVIAPFFLAFLWFEFLEPMLGFDKKKMHDDVEKIKRERIRKQLEK